MFGGDQNSKSHLKDEQKMLSIFTPPVSFSKFHSKSKKLVTAIYMVTDIMDINEPMRTKLRFLGGEILTDIYLNSRGVISKIEQIMSFLDIGLTMGMISDMNSRILKKEFLILKDSIINLGGVSDFWEGGKTLEDFLIEDQPEEVKRQENAEKNLIGQSKRSNIGLQRGGTLMRALSDRISNMSDMSHKDRNVLKKERELDIIKIIRDREKTEGDAFKGLTITDIKVNAKGSILGLGEKTIQRELVSLVKDNVLKKTGDKRWSRYFISTPDEHTSESPNAPENPLSPEI